MGVDLDGGEAYFDSRAEFHADGGGSASRWHDTYRHSIAAEFEPWPNPVMIPPRF